jgi:hypothetical protein
MAQLVLAIYLLVWSKQEIKGSSPAGSKNITIRFLQLHVRSWPSLPRIFAIKYIVLRCIAGGSDVLFENLCIEFFIWYSIRALVYPFAMNWLCSLRGATKKL